MLWRPACHDNGLTVEGSGGEPLVKFVVLTAAVMGGILIAMLMDLRNSRALIRVAAVAGSFRMAVVLSPTFSDDLRRSQAKELRLFTLAWERRT